MIEKRIPLIDGPLALTWKESIQSSSPSSPLSSSRTLSSSSLSLFFFYPAPPIKGTLSVDPFSAQPPRHDLHRRTLLEGEWGATACCRRTYVCILICNDVASFSLSFSSRPSLRSLIYSARLGLAWLDLLPPTHHQNAIVRPGERVALTLRSHKAAAAAAIAARALASPTHGK